MSVKACFLAVLLSTTCLAGNGKSSETLHHTWDVPSNAKVEIHVSAADVRVVQGTAGQVTASVLVQSGSPDVAGQIKMLFEMRGSTGVLTVKQPSHNADVTVTVKVPASTDLVVRSSAGDIDVDTASGSKDIETNAGDVRVTTGNSKQYAAVDVSTRAGDVSGALCGKASGHVGSSLHCDGKGKDRIRVHTTAGDVALRESSNEATMSKE